MPKVDPVAMIREQHKAVQGLFKQFEKAEAPLEREDIVQEVTTNLMNHTTLEEELFYPAVAKEGVEEDVLLEANEEHNVVEELLNDLVEMDPATGEYAAKFTVMMENVEHHMEEEEKEILKKFAGKLPEELGERMARRWEELTGENPPPSAERQQDTSSRSARPTR